MKDGASPHTSEEAEKTTRPAAQTTAGRLPRQVSRRNRRSREDEVVGGEHPGDRGDRDVVAAEHVGKGERDHGRVRERHPDRDPEQRRPRAGVHHATLNFDRTAHGSLIHETYTRPAVRRLPVAFALVAVVLSLADTAQDRDPSAAAAADTSVYAGLGTWISIFGTKAYAQPTAVAAAIAARGVKTVYLETSNYSQAVDVVRPEQLGLLVDALHARGLHVVAWYLPGFVEACAGSSPCARRGTLHDAVGRRFDGFALDIESTAVKRAAVRTQRVLVAVAAAPRSRRSPTIRWARSSRRRGA